MFARISLMFVVIAGLCSAAFTLGSTAAQGDPSGIPQEHPIALALRFHNELGLNQDQKSKLESLKGEIAKEFAPLRQQAEGIQRRMEELQKSGSQDQEKGKALQREAAALGEKIKPVMERFAQAAAQLLTPEQREKLMRLSEAHGKQGDPREFVLMFMMQAREQLGINPQQFTKLQYLQADFIRAFAPMREQMEMMQMAAHEKFGKEGKEPPPEFMQQVQGLQMKVKQLQAQFSERAVKDVLEPNQRAKLGELLGGGHQSGPNGK